MAETVEEVAQDFYTRMNDLAGVHGLSVVATTVLMPPWIDEQARSIQNFTEESSLFLGTGDPNVDGVAHLRWRYVDMPRHLDVAEGTVSRALGQSWLVTVAAEWNDNFRGRFAAANGVEKNKLKDAGLADINRMRNDVIHHRGIATERNCGRCEVFTWFRAGKVINPMMGHVAHFMAHLGLLHDTTNIDGSDGPWEVRAHY